MSDYDSFQYGGVVFPLEADSNLSSLRDADPALFYLLEFYEFCIRRYVGPRLMAEVSAAGMPQISKAVADIAPFNPAPFFIENHLKFPLLSAYRKATRFEWIGSRKHRVDEVEVCFVLPPVQVGEAERLMPLMNSIVAVLDNRTEMGFDPGYTPTQPIGTAGEPFWTRAGLAKAGLKSVSYGGFMPEESLYYPAVMLTVELVERSDALITSFEELAGANVTVDVADPVEPTVTDFIVAEVDAAPTLTLVSPNSGTKAGGTTITLTGTNFHSSLEPRVFVGGALAADIVVLSETQIQCKTPAHGAYPSTISDVEVVLNNGLSAKLVAAYTFTTP